MPIKKRYIPPKDVEFFVFQDNLIKRVVANKSLWNITDAAVNALTIRQAEYVAAYRKITNKNNRTSAQVLAHRQLRQKYEKELRAFAKAYLMYNPVVTGADKVSMGLTVPDTKPSIWPAISEVPFVGLKGMGGGEVAVICWQQSGAGRPRLHPDSNLIEVRYALLAVGEPLPLDPMLCPFTTHSTRARFTIRTGQESGGKVFYGYFRWANAQNPERSGVWCNVKTVIVG